MIRISRDRCGPATRQLPGHATRGRSSSTARRTRRARRVPLSMMNRHGWSPGPPATGKTVTLEVLAGSCQRPGVPVSPGRIKGDVSGMASPGTASDKLLQRTARSVRAGTAGVPDRVLLPRRQGGHPGGGRP